MGQASFELTQGVKRPAALRLLSDDRLARRAAEGDRAAFAVIFERHHQGLYRYCRAVLRHDEDARDALQTTFARAITALDGDERAVAIKPWLYRIAHNEAISLLRRRRPLDSIDGQPDLASQSPGPDDRVLASERMGQLLADLEQLPERQRGALLLRELNDLTYAEIAAAITTTEQAARQSVYEARVMLMELKEGRDMPCADVRQLVSERDGRLLRPRKVRAHLRACESCAGFRASIGARRADLGALAPPLPAAAAAALLHALLGGGGGGGWGGGGLVAALGAGKGAVAAGGSKGLATAAVLTIAGGALVTSTGTTPPADRGDREGAKPAVLEARAAPGMTAAPTGTTLLTVSAQFDPQRAVYVVGPHHAARAKHPVAAPYEQPAQQPLEAPLAVPAPAPVPVAPNEHAPAPTPTGSSAPDPPAGQVAPPSEEQGAGNAGDETQSGGKESGAWNGDGGDSRHRNEDSARGASNDKHGSKSEDDDEDAGAQAASHARSSQGRTAARQDHEDGLGNSASAMRRRDDGEASWRGWAEAPGQAKRGNEPDDEHGNGKNAGREDERGDAHAKNTDDERGNSKGKNAGRDDDEHGNGKGKGENAGHEDEHGNANAKDKTAGDDEAPRGNADDAEERRGNGKDDSTGGDDAKRNSDNDDSAGGDKRSNDNAGRDDDPRSNGNDDASARGGGGDQQSSDQHGSNGNADAKPAKSPR